MGERKILNSIQTGDVVLIDLGYGLFMGQERLHPPSPSASQDFAIVSLLEEASGIGT